LKEAGVWALVGPTISNRSKVELQELSFNTLKVLWEAGIPVTITMDHPVVPVGYLPTAAGYAVKAGLPYEEALKAITLNPAKVLGIDDRYGSLEVGKMADLVLWSGDPLEIQSEVEQVYIHGELVYQR
jgi:imidazolonepropionase-like amidohydrolase